MSLYLLSVLFLSTVFFVAYILQYKQNYELQAIIAANSEERKDLMNRLMAKDYAQYQAMNGPKAEKTGEPNFLKASIDRAARQQQTEYEPLG